MKQAPMTSRQVRAAFRAWWNARCADVPAYKTDLPAKRQAFSVFVDDLHRDGRISDRVADSVTMETPKPVYYINREGQGYRETVDQFDTRKEARAMVAEYRMADPSADHWISSRACAGWHSRG